MNRSQRPNDKTHIRCPATYFAHSSYVPSFHHRVRSLTNIYLAHHRQRHSVIRTIPLLLSKSPHFACICLSHSLIYVVSFVFRASWHGNLLSLRLLGNRASFQIGPLLTGSSDRAHSFLSLAPSRLSIKCSVGPYPIPNFLSPHPPCSHYPSPNIFPSPEI